MNSPHWMRIKVNPVDRLVHSASGCWDDAGDVDAGVRFARSTPELAERGAGAPASGACVSHLLFCLVWPSFSVLAPLLRAPVLPPAP